MAIHTGINYETMKRLQNQGRHGGLVSRGGAFMTAWMPPQREGEPALLQFDYLLEILKEHEVTLSFGNGMRAGAVHDATRPRPDPGTAHQRGARRQGACTGVQAIVEGPGQHPGRRDRDQRRPAKEGHEQKAVLHARARSSPISRPATMTGRPRSGGALPPPTGQTSSAT
jgi:phosphomethylpyrimidine synthase